MRPIEEFDTVEAEFDEETNVGRLTLNHPDALNALSDQLRQDIVEGLQWLEPTTKTPTVSRCVQSS